MDEENEGFRVDEKLTDRGEAEGKLPLIVGDCVWTDNVLPVGVDPPDWELERLPRNLRSVPLPLELTGGPVPVPEELSVLRLLERLSGDR